MKGTFSKCYFSKLQTLNLVSLVTKTLLIYYFSIPTTFTPLSSIFSRDTVGEYGKSKMYINFKVKKLK